MSQFVAGGYTCTYNAKALGQTADGYRISHQYFERLITGDSGGETPQDAVYRGVDQTITYRLLEAIAAGVNDLIHPYATVLGTPLTQGVVGRLDVGDPGGSPDIQGKAKALVLTAIAGTPAADQGPATITLPLSIIAKNFPIDILYAADLREIPIRQRIYPDAGVFGTVT